MTATVHKTLFLAGLLLASALGAVAAEPASEAKPTKEQSNIDRLVANQPALPPAASNDTAADKPMTINFSDFVKDGAGCGVPNLDTSAK